MLVNAGVREFVIADGYPDELAREIMEQAGVVVRRLEIPVHSEPEK
jgi:deoxycytidylate deaminase